MLGFDDSKPRPIQKQAVDDSVKGPQSGLLILISFDHFTVIVTSFRVSILTPLRLIFMSVNICFIIA